MIKEGPQRERVDREYIRERARKRKKRRKVNDDYDAIRRKEKQNSLFARDTIEKETFFCVWPLCHTRKSNEHFLQ